MILADSSPVSVLEVDRVGEKSYDDLLQEVRTIGSQLGVPYEMYDTTLKLLGQLRAYDEQTAKESLQSLPLALQVADAIADFYPGAAVDRPAIWSAALLHDVGKSVMPHSLIEKSNAGEEWTETDVLTMAGHAVAGARLAQDNGLPFGVIRAINEHHGKQVSAMRYGNDPALDYAARITRDCVAVADFTDAMLNRTNTRNAHMSRDDRLYDVRTDIFMVFDDYTNGDALAQSVYGRLTTAA